MKLVLMPLSLLRQQAGRQQAERNLEEQRAGCCKGPRGGPAPPGHEGDGKSKLGAGPPSSQQVCPEQQPTG